METSQTDLVPVQCGGSAAFGDARWDFCWEKLSFHKLLNDLLLKYDTSGVLCIPWVP